jgi:F-type H+-transporting ATPase subunit delta
VTAASATARAYAKALFELGRERGQVDTVGEELERLAGILEAQRELTGFFGRPWIGGAVKQRVAAEVATRLGLSRLVADFLALVAAQGRIDRLAAMATAYRDLADAAAGRARARVRTATALARDERAALAARLQGLVGRQVVMEEVTDPVLLGGFVAEIGSLIVDGSLDGQLARMRARLARD